MLIDGVNFYIIELLGHLNVFILVAHFYGILTATGGSHKGQILRAFPDSLVSQHAISHLCGVALEHGLEIVSFMLELEGFKFIGKQLLKHIVSVAV